MKHYRSNHDCFGNPTWAADGAGGWIGHGQMPSPPIEAMCSTDPDLWLVTADAHAWFEAHDRYCECDGVCTCEGDTA